jgi:rubrerythrin
MNMRLFLSTFVLIFLAELGDKTQLAAMARSATGDRATVFFAASSALVASTLIAVLFGSALTRLVSEHVLKIASGLLFLVFGLLILYSALFRSETPAAGLEVRPGMLARIALEAAVGFEEAAWRDYSRLAEQGDQPSALRALWERLASEERTHIEQLRHLLREHGAVNDFVREAASLPGRAELHHDVAAGTGAKAPPQLLHAIEHEEATARFYEELARVTHVASLQGLFSALAVAERRHAEELAGFQG